MTISWYPVIAVLKHTSPTAVPMPPQPRPQNTEPSASASTAVAPGGAVARLEVGGADKRRGSGFARRRPGAGGAAPVASPASATGGRWAPAGARGRLCGRPAGATIGAGGDRVKRGSSDVFC